MARALEILQQASHGAGRSWSSWLANVLHLLTGLQIRAAVSLEPALQPSLLSWVACFLHSSLQDHVVIQLVNLPLSFDITQPQRGIDTGFQRGFGTGTHT